MNTNDAKVQYEILEEINKFLYWGYDEKSDQDYDEPILKDIDFSTLDKVYEFNQFKSKEWNEDFLEITNSEIWFLSFHFPDIHN